MEKEQHDSMKGIKGKIYVGRVYAARAYASWVGWIFTVSTFLIVAYDKILELVPALIIIFPNVFVFVLIGIPIVLTILVWVGKWDLFGGSYKPEAIIGWQQNPEWSDFKEEFDEFRHSVKKDLNDIKKMVSNERG